RGLDQGLACLDGALAQRTGRALAPPKTYVPCTVRYDGKSWTSVGFRFKGGSTFRAPFQLGTSQKYPFRLHMTRFADRDPALKGQRFFGFNKLTFANGATDHTFMRDFLSSQLYEAFAVPAPKVAFYRVFLNHGQGSFYYGLFSMIEDPDGPMLAAKYKSGDGNLYKPTGEAATWRGKFERASFPKETNGAQADWHDIERAHAALHAELRDNEWRTGLERTFDVDLFLRWLVVTVFLSPTDTHGFGSPHNYYLYGDPGDGGRIKWLPWDNDSAFKGSAKPFLENVQGFPLIRRILDDPVYFARYRKLLQQWLAGPANPELLLARIQQQRQLLLPYMLGSEGEQAGYTFLRGQVLTDYDFQQLQEFITNRHQTLLDALQRR
ncbi:MAG TPA: CotH kinase family protein, partial [Polyangiaceae bacterium]|nr:CotH kinase family protein [Polyangiaceae bacterium]